MNPIPIERRNPLWEDSRVPRLLPSVIKTDVLLDSDDRAHKDLLLHKYGERIEKLSHQDRLSNFFEDAGFLTTVEIGQYFMTKDTAEFSQFTDAVACREYTLPRDEDSSEPKSWITGNTKIGPVLEVTNCCLHGKSGVEIRIMSVNTDNSHSWVRISHGLNKFVMNLNNNEQETSEVQFEEYALRLSASDFASRSKAKAKPQRRESASSSTRTIPIGELSIVLILQEQLCTSEPFKVIQDAVSLILLYRTMPLFRAASSNTFIMSDVQSICIPSSIQDDTGRTKFEQQTDSILSACGSHGQKP